MTDVRTDRETHIEHDLWHIDLALWLGKPSPALMGAMGVPLTPSDQALADLEETAVIALRRYAKPPASAYLAATAGRSDGVGQPRIAEPPAVATVRGVGPRPVLA